jgi:hypothetical protein
MTVVDRFRKACSAGCVYDNRAQVTVFVVGKDRWSCNHLPLVLLDVEEDRRTNDFNVTTMGIR